MADKTENSTVKSETVHRTSDGRKFRDRKKAELHERLLTAHSEYKRAEEEFTRLLAETFTTADGHPFDFTRWHYYRLTPWYGVPASVQELSIWPRDFRLPERRDVEGAFCVKVKNHQGGSEWREVNISELYWRRDAAELAAAESRAKQLVEMLRDERERAQKNRYGHLFDDWTGG